MIKRRSPQNIVLYTYILSDVVDFLQRAHSMGILRPSVKLVLTALVSLSVFNRNIHGLIISVCRLFKEIIVFDLPLLPKCNQFRSPIFVQYTNA